MMRVCHMTNVHSWDDTRIFFKECLSLANHGYQVSLVAPNAADQMVQGVNVIGVKNESKSRMYRSTILAFKVLLRSLKTKSSIYHFHDPELIWIGFILFLLGKKVVFDVHENVRAQITDKKWLRFPKLVSAIYGFFERCASRLFYIVIAEESYSSLFQKKNHSVTRVFNYPVIDTLAQFKIPHAQKKEKGILYVGLVSEARGIREIIQALHLLKLRNVEFTFHCVGPMSESVKDMMVQMKEYQLIQDSIVFYGRLPMNEAYKLSSKSKLALSVLHPVPNYIRSYSTKIFEYMAIGIPFIVSNFPLYDFVEQRNLGFTIDPFDVEEMANLMEAVLTDQINLDPMLESAHRVVENEFSWESQSKNLLKLYSELTSSNQIDELGGMKK